MTYLVLGPLNRNLEAAQVIILNLCAQYNGLLPAHTIMIGSADANGDSEIFLQSCISNRETARLCYRVTASHCGITRVICSKGDPYKGCHCGRPDRIIRYYLLAPGSWTTGGGCLDRDCLVTKQPALASSFSRANSFMSECVSLMLPAVPYIASKQNI